MYVSYLVSKLQVCLKSKKIKGRRVMDWTSAGVRLKTLLLPLTSSVSFPLHGTCLSRYVKTQTTSTTILNTL